MVTIKPQRAHALHILQVAHTALSLFRKLLNEDGSTKNRHWLFSAEYIRRYDVRWICLFRLLA